MKKEDTKPKGFKFSNFKVNKDKAENGVWFEFAPGFSLKVARFNSPKVQNYMRKKQKPYLRQINKGTLDEETSRNILRKTLSKFCLLGWKGLIDDDGKEIKYSEEKAFELLAEPDFLSEVIEIVQSRETFQDLDEADLEEATGN